ncbi:MAG: MerR family transcriptional regulator [Solobacterium sp.]|nr:MerR family transcriptional regulator [Solobacterium sp.]
MKKYFSIGETAEHFGIAPSALRWYETEGLLEPVTRNESGRRVYGEKEFRRINFILTLRNAGIPVEGIKNYVDLFYAGAETIPERKQILIEQLEQLKEEARRLNAVIEQLEEVIGNYENTLMKREMDSRSKDPMYGRKPQK